MQDILASALTPVDLWVLPTPDHSRWFARLDWYLNWRMCAGLAYAGLHLPAELRRVAEEHGHPVLPTESRATPLLVSPEGRLPARRCLVLEGAPQLETWLNQIARLAATLQARDVRVFLPTRVDPRAAEAAWAGAPNLVTHFIPDLEASA